MTGIFRYNPAQAINMAVYTQTVQASTGSTVYTLFKNGVATALSITIPASTAINTVLTFAATVAIGPTDLLSMQTVNNSSSSTGGVVGTINFERLS